MRIVLLFLLVQLIFLFQGVLFDLNIIGVLTMIVVTNSIFLFDSIFSAMALTDLFPLMATAIVIGGILMIWLSDRVVSFLEKN